MGHTLTGEKTIAFSIAQEILTTSVKIPTIPDNGRKIIEMVRTPKDAIDIPEFVRLLESDPGLFTRILQLANSPYYREVEKITSLRAAITRIGLVEIVNSVSLHFFQKLLPEFPDISGFSYSDFWTHSWACAVACRRLGHPNLDMGALPGDLYLTGMLQGIGKLLLAIHFPDDFLTCIERARESAQPLSVVERHVFGTTDSLIASRVLAAWNMPPGICEGVAFSQMPELAPPEHVILAGLTQFGCGIAALSGIGQSGDGMTGKLEETYFGKNPNLKIGQPEIQDKLVREILASVEENPGDRHRKKRYASPDDAPGMNQTANKGIFGWIKSFWS